MKCQNMTEEYCLCVAALDVMEAMGESGPLQPKHLREAVRKLKQRGGIQTNKSKKRLF